MKMMSVEAKTTVQNVRYEFNCYINAKVYFENDQGLASGGLASMLEYHRSYTVVGCEFFALFIVELSVYIDYACN